MKAEMPLPEGIQDNLSSRQPAICAVQPVLGHVLFKHQKKAMCKMQWFICETVTQGQTPSAKVQEYQLLLLRFLTASGSICYHNVREIPTPRISVSVLLQQLYMEGHLRDYEIEHLYNFLGEKLFWTSTRDHSPNYEVIPVSNSKSQRSLHLLLRNGELGTDQPAFCITPIPRWDCLNCRKQLEYPIIWYPLSEGTMIKAYCSLWASVR